MSQKVIKLQGHWEPQILLDMISHAVGTIMGGISMIMRIDYVS